MSHLDRLAAEFKPNLNQNPHQILVFGGSYSNRQALEAMRENALERGFSSKHIWFTGDVIAYCADAAWCVDAMLEWGVNMIGGNCEESIVAGADDCGCGFDEGSACDLLSKGWYPHAKTQISETQRSALAQVPYSATFDWMGLKVAVVHGGFDQVNRFIFASEQEVIDQELAKHPEVDLVLAGHNGIPFTAKGGKSGKQIWHNAGVIGMPANDGTPDGWYSVITRDGDSLEIEHCRLSYDAQGAAQTMSDAKLSPDYAKALTTGLWPSLDVLPDVEKDATGVALDPKRLSQRIDFGAARRAA